MFLDGCVFELAPANLQTVAFHACSDMSDTIVDEYESDSAC